MKAAWAIACASGVVLIGCGDAEEPDWCDLSGAEEPCQTWEADEPERTTTAMPLHRRHHRSDLEA